MDKTSSVEKDTGITVLKVLSGAQSGVQKALKDGRYLLGDDPGSCDLVVEVGSGVLCLLVVEGALVMVQPLSGQISLPGRPLAQGKLARLPAMTPLTLGDVHFAIGDSEASFDQIVLPVAQAAAAGKTHAPRPRPFSAALAGITGLVGIGLAAAVVWLGVNGLTRDTIASLSAEQVTRMKQELLTRELNEVQLDMKGEPAKLHASGYVADREALRALNEIVERSPSGGVIAVQRIDDLQLALTSRVGKRSTDAEVQYLGKGQFRVTVQAAEYPVTRSAVEEAFRDLPSLMGTEVVVADVVDVGTRQASVIKVTRLPGSTGRVDIAGDNLPMIMSEHPQRMFIEVRRGRVPSVVTRGGRRLFVGASLEDGSRITGIDENGVVLMKGNRERMLSFAPADSWPRRYLPARRIHVARSNQP